MNQYNITYDEKYRANPQNRYHKEYKRAVNRWFSFSLIAMILSVTIAEYGVEKAILAVASLFIGVLVGGFALYILANMISVLASLYEWLCGH